VITKCPSILSNVFLLLVGRNTMSDSEIPMSDVVCTFE